MNRLILCLLLTLGFSQQNISTKQFTFFKNNSNDLIDFGDIIPNFNGKYLVKLISIDDIQFDRTKKIMMERCDLKFKLVNINSKIDISRCDNMLTYEGTIYLDENSSTVHIKYPKYNYLNCMLTFWISGNFVAQNNSKNIKDGILNEYYDDAKLKIEYKFKNGKKHGIQKRWYNNGQLEILYNYDNSKLDGLQQKWHQNGVLKGEWHYQNDKLHGIIKEWYNNKNIKFIKKYEDGTLIEILENNNIDGSSF